jgi:hypothetical protein
METVRSKAPGFPALWVSLPLALLVAATAGAGLWWPPTYARESALWAAEGMGGDAVNLFVIVPVLLLTAGFRNDGGHEPRELCRGFHHGRVFPGLGGRMYRPAGAVFPAL